VRTTVKDAIDAAEKAAYGNAAFHSGAPDASHEVAQGPGLLDAFNAVGAPFAKGAGERVDPRRLGKWLGKHKDRVVGGLRMVLVPEKRDGNSQWCLQKVG
jgi:hypothetical protein